MTWPQYPSRTVKKSYSCKLTGSLPHLFDAESRHKTSFFRKDSLKRTATAVARISAFVLIVWGPIPTGWYERPLQWYPYTLGYVRQRNFELRKPWDFIMGSKSAWPLPWVETNFFIILKAKELTPLLRQKYCLYLPRLFAMQTSWRDGPEQRQLVPLFTRQTRETHGKLSSKSI